MIKKTIYITGGKHSRHNMSLLKPQTPEHHYEPVQDEQDQRRNTISGSNSMSRNARYLILRDTFSAEPLCEMEKYPEK